MKEYKININVYCFKKEGVNPAYRLYVDGDLITERTYVWTNANPPAVTQGQFVKENVWVNLEPGEHEVKIEAVDPTFSGFYFSDLMLDDGIVNGSAMKTRIGRFIISE